MEKFKSIYRIPSARLQHWDYGSHGFYFVTICTQNRLNYFGEIADPPNLLPLMTTKTGEIAGEYWLKIPSHYPFVDLDEFVVMPNHIHGILFFNKPDKQDWVPNKFGPQSGNLAAVIRGYKSAVKKFATLHNIEFSWQTRFHDHIIRSEKELSNIREYIIHNPNKWSEDRFHHP